MSDHAWAIIGNIAAVLGIAAWVNQRVKKWAKDNLIQPIEKVVTATTKNGGQANPSTVLDWLHAIRDEQHAQGEKLDQHLGWSQAETDRRKQVESDLWAAINRRP